MNGWSFINDSHDLQWLFETHLVDLYPARRRFRAAVIYGNEDAPERIDLYEDRNPCLNDLRTIITL